jgi:hypothetical protein
MKVYTKSIRVFMRDFGNIGRKERQPVTSATRAAAVVFGVHLSARAIFRLDRN